MENKQPVKLDHLLDRALADCPQMPLGLEAQILQHVSRAESKRRRRASFVVSAIALAASLLVVALMQQSPVPAKQTRSQPAPVLAQRTEMLPERIPLRRVSRRSKRKPIQRSVKRDVFPTPTPMTAEEKVLVQFVQNSPAAAKALADLQRRGAEPLHIEALNIVPLTEERSKSEEKQ